MEPYTRENLEKWITRTSNLLVDHQKQLTSRECNRNRYKFASSSSSSSSSSSYISSHNGPIIHRKINPDNCNEEITSTDNGNSNHIFGQGLRKVQVTPKVSSPSSCYTGFILSLVPVAILIILLLFFTLYLVLSLSIVLRSN